MPLLQRPLYWNYRPDVKKSSIMALAQYKAADRHGRPGPRSGTAARGPELARSATLAIMKAEQLAELPSEVCSQRCVGEC